MDTSNWNTTTIAAIIALGGVLISASVAYMTASRTVYVNAITTARIKWIETVRKLVSEHKDRCLQIGFDRSKGISLVREGVFTIVKNHEELRLTLGRGPIEKNILRLARLVAITHDFDEAKKYCKLLALHTQFLLEIEWKRIKSEAGYQILQPKEYGLRKHLQRYRRFCEKDGGFPGCEIGAFKVPALVKDQQNPEQEDEL